MDIDLDRDPTLDEDNSTKGGRGRTAAAAGASMLSTTSASSTPGAAKARASSKSYEIYSCTVRDPPFAYARLRLVSDEDDADAGTTTRLDALQAHSYCTAALTQFLGLTGAAVSVEVLRVHGAEFWVRVPRPDLGRFSASVTAWAGVVSPFSGASSVLRLVSCGDWLGSLLGRDEQQKLWNP